jgi:ISXO2-like transposase domain
VKAGYRHRVTAQREPASRDLLPRVHRVVGLLKGWLLGTHQGGVSAKHLDYYLDEFTFRFNRRRSRHRGKLFCRLAQQGGRDRPAPLQGVGEGRPQPVGVSNGGHESTKYLNTVIQLFS